MATIKFRPVTQHDLQSFFNILKRNSLTPHDFLFDSRPYVTGTLDIINQLDNLIPPGKKILDLGCGSGLTSFLLSKNYQVQAVDVFESDSTQFHHNGKMAQQKLWNLLSKNKKNLKFNFFNGKNLNYPQSSFDLVFAHAVIEHIHPNKMKSILAEIKKVLKPGAYLVIARTPEQLALSELLIKSHDVRYSLKDLLNLFPKKDYLLISSAKTDFFPQIAPFPFAQKMINSLYPLTRLFDRILNHSPLKIFSHHHLLFFQKR